LTVMGDRMIDQVVFCGGVLFSFETINFAMTIVCMLMDWRNTLSRILLFFITLQFITGLLTVLPPFSSNAICYNTTRVDEVFLALVAGGYNLYLYFRVRTILKRKVEHIYPLFAVVASTLISYLTLVTNERLCVDGVMVSYAAVNNSNIARAVSYLISAGNDCYCLGIFSYRLSASLALKSKGRIVHLWLIIRNFTLLAIPMSITTAMYTLSVDVTNNTAYVPEFIMAILTAVNWTPLLLGHLFLCFNRLSADSVERMVGLTSTSQRNSASGTGQNTSLSTKKRPVDSGTHDSMVSSSVFDGTQDEKDIDIEAQ